MEFERIKSLLIPSFLYNTKNDGLNYYVGSGLCWGLSLALFEGAIILDDAIKNNKIKNNKLSTKKNIRPVRPLPTVLSVTTRGACTFGFYEFFKKYYSDLAGLENADKYKTTIYLASSAHAFVTADVAYYPFRKARVHAQNQGDRSFYKYVQRRGKVIPYMMMYFTSFETTVELLYKHAITKPKSECSTPLQLGVSFAGGYGAGTLCGVVASPIDNLASYLRRVKGSTVCDAVNKMVLWTVFSRMLLPRMVGFGIFSGVQWGLYDAFKVLVGLPTTGGAAPVYTLPAGSN